MSEGEMVYRSTMKVGVAEFIELKKREFEKNGARAAYLVVSLHSYLKLKHECAIELGGYAKPPYKFMNMEIVVLENMKIDFVTIGGEAL